MNVLVVNTGSSSLKLSVLDENNVMLAERHIERWHGEADLAPLTDFLSNTPHIDAVGHRVVHGGPHLVSPVLITDQVRDEIERLTNLAPLHQPRALAGITAITELLHNTPQVACFDTAFHTTMPAFAATYALPAKWRQNWDLRRYGFHGLSHAYASQRVMQLMAVTQAKVITCHLGAGCSLAAVRDGSSVDTTMGFTPLAGLPMSTRSGDVDPGVLLWLLQNRKLTVAELADGLAHKSGLVGLSGWKDLRDVHKAADRGDPTARLAIEIFIHRLRQEILAMTASLGGLDMLVFTGGIGEHDSAVRAQTVTGINFLGVKLDAQRNAAPSPELPISAESSAISVWVIPAREDIVIASDVRAALN